MEAETTDLMGERIALVRATGAFGATDRIPTMSNYWTYMILDAGMKLSEAIYDYDKLYAAVTRFHEKYGFDYYAYTGSRNPFRVTDAVGGNFYIIDDEADTLSIKDNPIMFEDEYDQLIADPKKFFWSVTVPRKCRKVSGPDSFEAFEESTREYDAYLEFGARVSRKFTEDYRVPARSGASALFPFETLFNHLRGIKGLSVDLRRRPEQVKEAVRVLSEYNNVESVFTNLDKPVPGAQIFACYQVFLGHSILNPKQFGELYWPYLRRLTEACAKNGVQMQIHTESQMLTFADYFQEIPKGVLVLQPELDSPFEVRRRLPNLAIAGGISPDYLGRRSREECLDFARRLIGELGPGLIMGQSKMMSYKHDAVPENILAVQDLCRSTAVQA